MKKVLQDLKLDTSKDNKLLNLFKKVKEPEALKAHIKVPNPNQIYQADLLFLPNDNGYKYLLVVVDTFDNKMDARPLKTKENKEVLKAFKSIFEGSYLKMPKYSIQTDSGSEFKGSLKTYMNKHNIIMKYGRPNRHRQQGLVENYNKTIAKLIFFRQSLDELQTGKESKAWIDDIPKIVKTLNKNMIKDKSDSINEKVLEKETGEILRVKTKVRVMLDAPKSISNKKLHGDFRETDIRWEIEPREIEEIYLRPDQPVFYKVSGINNAFYTKYQLQVIKEEELPEQERFTIEKLIKKKKINNKIYYFVKWFGYSSKENTWEPRVELVKDAREIVKEFEKK